MSNFEKVGVIFVTGLVAVILAMSFFGTGQDQLLTSRASADERITARADTDPPSVSESLREETRERSGAAEPAEEGVAAGPSRGSGGGIRALADAWRDRSDPDSLWNRTREQEPIDEGIRFDDGASTPERPALRMSEPEGSRAGPKEIPATLPESRAPEGETEGGRASDPEPRTEPPAPDRTYVVRKGDSLCDIAEELLGHEKHWKLLQQANPDVRPERLMVGTRLAIPPRPDGEPAKRVAAASEAPEAAGTRRAAGSTKKEPTARVHRVAPGDSLIRIARAELDDPGKWRDILALNRDRIRNADVLPVGLELRLPE
jgi:nucleoid-associated protein YgaU